MPIESPAKSSIFDDLLENKRLLKRIKGGIVLDIDGTLTDPDNRYLIYRPVLETLALFLKECGMLIFATGASLKRVEDFVIHPLLNLSDLGFDDPRLLVVLPEYGSAICFCTKQPDLIWTKKRELHTADKDNLRRILEENLGVSYQGMYFAGSLPTDRIKRDYTIGLKGVKNPQEYIVNIETTIMPLYPEFNWQNISIHSDLNSIDFVNKNAGKDIALICFLNAISTIKVPIIGFGDTGDEFARVVPTFNVNSKENLFESGKLPYLEAAPHLRGAGETVAWTIRRLLDLGYFN